MNLKKELNKVNESFKKAVPKDMIEFFDNEIEKLAKSKLSDSILKVGNIIPEFSLKNAVGERVSVYDLLEEGPIILNFYRGSWCPYCNLELAAYQELLPEIHARGAQLVAISPELPDQSLNLIDKHALKYEILTDSYNKVAKAFGLVFELSEEMKKVYDTFGIDLEKSQGNTQSELPIPATFVVNESGKIILGSANIDYRERLEPEEAVSVL